MVEHQQTERAALISSLCELAEAIERCPPTIIGSDIFVQASEGGSAVGSSISISSRPGMGSASGQRISVVADRPGQSVIGQRIVVVAGERAGIAMPVPAGAQSQEEIATTVQQLRDAAIALESSPASLPWIKGILSAAEKWGSAALSGAISGATNAATKFYMGG